jgi:putative transcriptional regulator
LPSSRGKGNLPTRNSGQRWGLGVLLIFLLTEAFVEGTPMRDDLLDERRMTLTDLADRIGFTLASLSILKTGKARAIRFSTLEAISCQPGDLLRFEPKLSEHERPAPRANRRRAEPQTEISADANDCFDPA